MRTRIGSSAPGPALGRPRGVRLGAFATLALLLAACGGGDDGDRNGGDAPTGAVTGALVGRVTDEAGRPVQRAFVEPTSLDTPAAAVPEIAVFTDESGRYRWTLEPGRYEVATRADGYRRAVEEVEVRGGTETTLDFTLSRAG